MTTPPQLTNDLRLRAQTWMQDDPDPVTRAELADLLDRAETEPQALVDLTSRFEGPLVFGTAGIRGRLGAGESRINVAVICRIAAGLASYLMETAGPGSAVVVGCDTRHGSRQFYDATVQILTAAGLRVRALPAGLPTPVTAFWVRRTGAEAGVMITASHNPADDNGFKVYLGGRAVAPGDVHGAQLIPPHDALIAERIAQAPPAVQILAGALTHHDASGDDATDHDATDHDATDHDATDTPTSRPLTADAGRSLQGGARLDFGRGKSWEPGHEVEAYLRRVMEVVDGPAQSEQSTPLPPARSLRIVFTPLHGVGGEVAMAALSGSGYLDVFPVPEQLHPDPDFPTTPYPNPEEPGVLALAMNLATQVDADIVVALDPDADRCSAAIPLRSGGWRQLTGDEVGCLLGEDLASRTPHRSGSQLDQPQTPVEPPVGLPGDTLVSSVVSSTLLAKIAHRHGLRHVSTPTGFKWISRVETMRYGYEEALGYCVDPAAVRDKDGISAMAAILSLADRLAGQERTVEDALDDLAFAYGLHATSSVSLRFEDTAHAARAMQTLRGTPPLHIADAGVQQTIDLRQANGDLPPVDGLLLFTELGDRIIFRPSGTEAKLKCYLEVVLQCADGVVPRQAAHDRLAAIAADVERWLAQNLCER